jgi:RNA polymerase sigma-70 factor (ECF subfamily)
MIYFKRPGTKQKDNDETASFQEEALIHMESLYQGALYMTRDPAEAEDLVQETFLKAHRFWGRYQKGTNCKAWLYRIMTNTLINRRRKKKHAFSLLEETDTDSSTEGAYDHSVFYSGPENTYLQGMLPDRVLKAIESLPESFRVPVVLSDLQDFSYKEIAEIMDCPVGTVMSRLFRGRKRLQELLFDHAVEQGVIAKRDAADDDGALSLDAYREKKKAGDRA